MWFGDEMRGLPKRRSLEVERSWESLEGGRSEG